MNVRWTLQRTVAVMVWAAGCCALAQNPPVPAAFEDTFNELQTSIGSFQSIINSSWNGKPGNVLYSGGLLNANANNGLPFLLDNTPGATAEINLLRSMGARAVTVNMAFPIVTQDFYGYNGDPQDYAKVLAFYQNIATQVHRAGMKLIVEAALVYPATPGMNIRGYYDSLSDAQFIAGRAKNLLVIAQQIQPDFLNLNSEPDTELVNSGGKSNEYGTPQAFAALNQSNISQLRAAGITIPLGVGVGTWLKSQSGGAADWVAALVKISGLSFFDIHVYPVTGDYLPNLIAYTEQAQAAGLPVSMAQTWVNKESSAEWASQFPPQNQVYARNAFSFWQPIDQAYITALVDFAQWKRLLFISPFWIQCFSAYLDYNQVGNLPLNQVNTMENSAAAAALGANRITPTGTSYRGKTGGVLQVPAVSAANYLTTPVAANSIVSIFGTNLSTGTGFGTTLPLPTTLAETTATIVDSSGNQQPLPFFYVSPLQINAQIPPGLSNGTAIVTYSSHGSVVGGSNLIIANVGPGLFTANQNGQGVPLGIVTTNSSSGSQTSESQTIAPVYQGSAVGSYMPASIGLGASGDQSVLVVYGTGIRGAGSLSSVKATIGTTAVPVLYAGPSDPDHFVALDQVNIGLPHSLAGSGQVNLMLTVDGVAAPPVTLDFE